MLLVLRQKGYSSRILVFLLFLFATLLPRTFDSVKLRLKMFSHFQMLLARAIVKPSGELYTHLYTYVPYLPTQIHSYLVYTYLLFLFNLGTLILLNFILLLNESCETNNGNIWLKLYLFLLISEKSWYSLCQVLE